MAALALTLGQSLQLEEVPAPKPRGHHRKTHGADEIWAEMHQQTELGVGLQV